MNTVIEPSVINGIMQELEIPDVKKASIRQIGAVVREAEKRTGTEYIHFEMGVPGLPPSAVGVKAECVTARAEEAVATRRETYDFATSRAVARLNILLELTAPYVRIGGAVLALKGSAAREELEEAKNAVTKLGLKVETVRDFSIDGATHSVIVLRKVTHTPPQYPRRYAKIKQSPL